MELKETDIKLLDSIIDKILEVDWFVDLSDFPEIGKLANNSTDAELEFQRLLSFVKECNCGMVEQKNFGYTVSKNAHTRSFKENGGFKKVFENMQIEHTKLQNKNRKEEREQRMTRWKYITFWPVMFFGLFGGLYSAYKTITSSQEEERLNKIERNILENKKQNQQIQTIILNQKDKDSVLNVVSENKISPCYRANLSRGDCK